MFLDQSFPPDSRVENEATTLIEAGHEVVLFSLNFKGIKPAVEVVNQIKVCRQPASKLLYRLSALAYTVPFFHLMIKKVIRNFIDEVRPEALHVHDMLIAKAVLDINDRYFQLPLTLDLHENRPEILRYYPHLQRFPGKQLINLGRWKAAQSGLIKRADHVVLVTQQAVEEAMTVTNESISKFLIVPNTIKPNIFLKYPLREEIINRFQSGFNLIYVGDTGLRRGLDTTIEAMGLVKEQVPEIQLIVVGKSSQDHLLQKMVEEHGLQDKVFFEGWQDVSKFLSYIKAAHVGISPIHRNKHHDTTLANKIFQYMACACPVLVSDCPGQSRVVEDIGCGLVFQAQNAQAMADGIMKLYNDSSLRLKMGELGKEAVMGTYSWDEMSKVLAHHYDHLTNTDD